MMFDFLSFNLVTSVVEQFGLQGPESYLFTSRSGCLDVEGIDDVQDYHDTIVSGL
jgi:myosin heavy subunit